MKACKIPILCRSVEKANPKGEKMNKIKIALVLIVAIFVLLVAGGVTPTLAGSPNTAPPTVVLPTPVAPKPAATLVPAGKAPTRAAPAGIKQPVAPTAVKGKAPNVVPAPGAGFLSAFKVQNISSTGATCSFAFYDAAGATKFTSASISIGSGGSALIYLGDAATFGSLASGSYSGVVSCDQQAAAVVNFSQGSGLNSSGDNYAGIGTPATTWYAPALYNNFYNYYTNVIVQNATASTVNITLNIYPPGSSTAVSTQTQSNVPAYASVSFDQNGLAGLSPNVSYSAQIIGTGNIAPVVNIYGSGGGVDWQLYSYNPFASGSTTVYAPINLSDFYGYNSAMAIQNIDTAAANVTVTYGTGQTWSGTIQPSSSQVLVAKQAPSSIPANTSTGATITSTNGKNLVVLVNQSNAYGRAGSYAGFAAGKTTSWMPTIFRRFYFFNSAVQCQNVGSSATTMTITYYTTTGAVVGSTTSPSVAINGVTPFYNFLDSNLTDGNSYGAKVTSSQNIVCVVNEDINEGAGATTYQDQFYSYDGFGQ
jgi:hypothetical protein